MKIISLLMISVLLVSCASSRKGAGLENLSGSTPNFTESSEEAALGAKIHEQILASFYPYTEPKAVEYVNKVGRVIAEQAERRDLTYRFIILYSDKVYATSAPGGYVYITTGLVNFLHNESELASVLAHEVGRLQLKDPKLSRGKQILDKLTHGGAAIGPAFGQIGALAVLGFAMLDAAVDAQGAKMTPERKLLDADDKALHYMVEAGYDPQGMFDVIQSFAKAEPGLEPYFYDYYQARPITTDRLNHMQKIFSELPLQGKSFLTHPEIYRENTQGIREIYKT